MEFFKNRKNAIFIAVIVVIFSILFGSFRSARSEAQKVIDQFSNSDRSIYSQLMGRCDLAMQMFSTASSYNGSEIEEAAENLRSKRSALITLLDTDSGASSLYQANNELQLAGEELYNTLSVRDDISDYDLKNLNDDFSTFQSAQRAAIEDSEYNDLVREFNRSVLSFFPLNMIKAIITTPELFA